MAIQEMASLLDWLLDNESIFRKSRLPSLYSDLSVQKTTNPEGYAANVTAWQTALARAALAGRLPTGARFVLRPSEELLDALVSVQYGRPSGLGLVLDESVRSGKMLDLNDFLAAEKSIYQRSWVPSPWAVLKWGLRQAGVLASGSYDLSGRLREGQLVLIAALEETYRQIMAGHEKEGQSITDRIQSRDAFVAELATGSGVSLSPLEVDVLLHYLARDKQVLSYDSTTVKWKPRNSAIPEPVSQEDATIASLKALLSNLEQQILAITEKIQGLQDKALAAVKNNNKHLALSALKSKRLAEDTLQKRTDALRQLEEVYTKIEQAVDQVQLVQIMESSAYVLRGLNKQVGGVEKVENVIEDLREQMIQVDEVGQVLEEPLDSKAVIDEADVEQELEAMEKEEATVREHQDAEATKKRLDELDATKARIKAEALEKKQDDDSLRSSIEQLDRMRIDSSEVTNPSTKIPERAT